MGPRYEAPNEATGLKVPSSSRQLQRVSPQPAITDTLTLTSPHYPAQPEAPVLDETAATVEAPIYVAEVEDEAERVRQKVEHFEYDFSDDVLMTKPVYDPGVGTGAL